MTYKEAIEEEMVRLSEDSRVMFLGYNTRKGHQMYGTLARVPPFRIVETPVVENLMVGLGIGMALEGYRPIVCFERSNFLLCAADAIINQLDKLPKLSGGQFDLPVVIRVLVGTDKPINPGLQHVGDYTDLVERYTDIEVRRVKSVKDVRKHYKDILTKKGPTCIVEYKELYENVG